MCEECGCGMVDAKENDELKMEKPNDRVSIDINKSIATANNRIADNISHALNHKKILCINIMGSPGSGKTSLIESVARIIGMENIAVIQGDLESDVDKKRLEKSGIYTYQINTHSGCHLNSDMINNALLNMELHSKKFLFIENVGNLVCPAGVKIGQHMNIVISSTAEGSDKPKKYPYIFNDADLIIISKSDIAEAVDFEKEAYLEAIEKINGKADIIFTSTKKNIGFEPVAKWIMHEREHLINSDHHHH